MTDLNELKRLAAEVLAEVGTEYTMGVLERWRRATGPAVVLALIERLEAAEKRAACSESVAAALSEAAMQQVRDETYWLLNPLPEVKP